MHPFSIPMRTIGMFALAPICAISVLGTETGKSDPQTNARLNCGARIECIMPETLPQNRHAASVFIMKDDSISCPLKEGETTFVVALPRSGALERLKFVNENIAARGTLMIAVANERLAPDSAGWTPVDGNVAFQHKRLFNLSVVGVAAKFVRVIFKVEPEVNTPDFTLTLGNFERARRGIFGLGSNEIPAKPNGFGDNLALSSGMPLIAALNR